MEYYAKTFLCSCPVRIHWVFIEDVCIPNRETRIGYRCPYLEDDKDRYHEITNLEWATLRPDIADNESVPILAQVVKETN